VKFLETSVETIKRAYNRDLFRKSMMDIGISIQKSKKANTVEETVQAARETSYPVMKLLISNFGDGLV
jgi:carbamoyl-phosphate synthase large subunit